MAIYSDINLKKTSEKTRLYDIDDIIQSIETILFTRNRTRMFNRRFGTDIDVLLFEPLDRITALKIYDATLTKIETYEPRVKMLQNKSSVTINFQKKSYDVILAGTVLGLNNESFEYRGQLQQKNPLLTGFITGVV